MNQRTVKRIKENRFVRIIAYPLVQTRRKVLLERYQKSEDSRYIRSLKDTYIGERCFVIGNGPSLTPEDLNILATHNIFCFAANRIYKIYPRTVWRPSIYMAIDRNVIGDSYEELKSAGDYPKIINYKSAHLGRQSEDNIHYLYVNKPFKLNPYRMTVDTLSEDPSKFSVITETVTVSSVELAIYMGFTHIYLLSVDNNYAHKRMPDGTVFIDPNVQKNYFQGGEPSDSLGPSIQPVELLEKIYEVAKKFAESHGVKIYNATRGGKLEVFERVDFDMLMEKTTHEQSL